MEDQHKQGSVNPLIKRFCPCQSDGQLGLLGADVYPPISPGILDSLIPIGGVGTDHMLRIPSPQGLPSSGNMNPPAVIANSRYLAW